MKEHFYNCSPEKGRIVEYCNSIIQYHVIANEFYQSHLVKSTKGANRPKSAHVNSRMRNNLFATKQKYSIYKAYQNLIKNTNYETNAE